MQARRPAAAPEAPGCGDAHAAAGRSRAAADRPAAVTRERQPLRRVPGVPRSAPTKPRTSAPFSWLRQHRRAHPLRCAPWRGESERARQQGGDEQRGSVERAPAQMRARRGIATNGHGRRQRRRLNRQREVDGDAAAEADRRASRSRALLLGFGRRRASGVLAAPSAGAPAVGRCVRRRPEHNPRAPGPFPSGPGLQCMCRRASSRIRSQSKTRMTHKTSQRRHTRRALCALAHGLPAHRRRPHRPVQLALRQGPRRQDSAAHRGYGPRAQQPGGRRRHSRRPEVAGARLGRRTRLAVRPRPRHRQVAERCSPPATPTSAI